MFVASGVLLPLGLWLLLGSQPIARERPKPSRRARALILLLALVVGVVGGIYGIGGGSLLAPVLLIAGFSPYETAPATLLATFLTSLVGIATYAVLQLAQGGNVAPEWVLGRASALAASPAATSEPGYKAACRKRRCESCWGWLPASSPRATPSSPCSTPATRLTSMPAAREPRAR
jgi:hypothetical protein